MRLVFCLNCGVCLGENRPNFAKEHLQKFSGHDNFLIKTIIDPLILENPDFWFKEHENRFNRKLFWQPKVTGRRSTDDETEPEEFSLNLN